MEQIVNFINNNPWVFWIPTFLFIFIVVLGTLVGFIRGFRSSMFRLAIMIISLVGAIVTFTILVANDGKTFYEILNSSGVNLEEILSVEAEEKTILGVFRAYILQQVAENAGGYDQIAVEMYPQIEVWAIMAMRFSGFIVSLVCYLVFMLILNIFYFIFFRESKYKKALKEKNQVYRRHRLLGSGIGLIRGTIAGLVTFSFLGWILFSVTGGKEETNEVSFKDPTISNVYDINNFIKTFGNTGIFKVLNQYKDSDNVPFYLFFADAIISGKTVDYAGNEYVVSASDELVSISGLANDLLDLLAKYGAEDLTMEIISGADSEGAMKLMRKLFDDEEFNRDLIQIIDNYKSTEYLKNITKIAIGSIANNFETLVNNAIKDNDELVANICGFYDAMFSESLGDKYLSPADIVTFEDAKILLKSAIGAASDILKTVDYTNEASKEDQLGYYVNLTNLGLQTFSNFYTNIEKLSFWSADAAKTTKMNGVISRGINYAFDLVIEKNNINYENPFAAVEFNWINEFNAVEETFASITSLTNLLVEEEEINNSMARAIEVVFSNEYAKKVEVDESFATLVDKVNNYESVEVLFNSDFIYGYLETTLEETLAAENITIPRDLRWTDEIVDGKRVDGELRILLDSLRVAAANGLISYVDPKIDFKDINNIKGIVKILNSAYNQEKSIAERLFESKIIHYGSSIFITYYKIPEFEVVVPTVALDTNGMISQTELINMFKSASVVINEIDSLDDFTNDPNKVIEIIQKEDVKTAITKSDVLQATATNYLVKMVKQDEEIGKFITISPMYDYTNGDIDTVYGNWKPEFSNILTALGYFDIEKITANDPNYYVELLNLPTEDIDIMLKSNIIWCSVGNILQNLPLEDFEMIIPNTVKEEFDGLDVVSKTEIKSAFKAAAKVVVVAEGKLSYDLNAVTRDKEVILTSDILHATVINYFIDMSNSSDISAYVKLPTKYQVCDFTDFANSSWYGLTIEDYELYRILVAVEELEIDFANFANIDSKELINKVLILDNPAINDAQLSKIEVVAKSDIISRTLSYNLMENEQLKGKIFVPETAISPLSDEVDIYIKVSEWKNLIFGLKNAFGITENDDLTTKFTDLNPLIQNLFSEIYYEQNKTALITSLVLEETIVKHLNSSLADNEIVVLPNVLNDKNGGSYSWYARRDASDLILEQGELSNLLDVFFSTGLGSIYGNPDFNEELNKTFEIGNLFYTATDTPEDRVQKDNLREAILKSVTINATIINQIVSLNDGSGNNPLAIPSRLQTNREDLKINYNSNFVWVLDEELENMFIALNTLELPIEGNMVTIDANTILGREDIDTLVDSISSSKIVYLTISTKIKSSTNSVLVYLDEAISPLGELYEETVISKEEFRNMLQGIISLGINDFNSIDFDASKVFTNNETILKSLILRATISNEIIKARNNELALNTAAESMVDLPYVMYHLNDMPTFVLKETEISSFLNAINIIANGQFTNFNFEIDIQTISSLNDEDIYFMTSSTIAKAIVSDMLLTSKVIVSGKDIYNSQYADFTIDLNNLGSAYDLFVSEYTENYQLPALEAANYNKLVLEEKVVTILEFENEYINQAQIIALKQMFVGLLG